MKRCLGVVFSILISGLCTHPVWPETDAFSLLNNGQSDYSAFITDERDAGLQFAAHEVQSYINIIADVKLPIVCERPAANIIAVGKDAALELGVNIEEHSLDEEGFVRLIQPGKIILAGNSRRATLYAVYSFLEDLGCRWYAPNFEFYGNAGAEFIPKRTNIELQTGQFVEEPTFSHRAKRVEEGWSITPERLVLIIDWLAKTRHNVFNMTIDYGGTGRIPYEKYRESIIPEIRKRGLLLHIGGHNYSLFLPDSYFEDHPDWFGMNSRGERVPMLAGRVNFNTANPEAVATFIENCKQWLKRHPEIDLFSLVPEDSPVWDSSPESRRLGSIPNRHAVFANQVLKKLKEDFPDLKVTLPAYQALIRPPDGIAFEDNAIVGVAMIRRDNTRPFFDVSSQKNLYYLNYLWQWLDSGAVANEQISLGGYYRRYAFRSLPILNFSILQSDLKYASLLELTGLGEYGEPGDWFTFELIHYLSPQLLWNPSVSVSKVLEGYASDRFGPAQREMLDLFFLLDNISGQIVRGFGNYTRFDSDTPFPELAVQEIVTEPARAYMRHLQTCQDLLQRARAKIDNDPVILERIEKWKILLDYLAMEMQAKSISEVISSVSPYGQLLTRLNQIYEQMQKLVDGNRDRGLFLLEDRRLEYSIKPPVSPPGS